MTRTRRTTLYCEIFAILTYLVLIWLAINQTAIKDSISATLKPIFKPVADWLMANFINPIVPVWVAIQNSLNSIEFLSSSWKVTCVGCSFLQHCLGSIAVWLCVLAPIVLYFALYGGFFSCEGNPRGEPVLQSLFRKFYIRHFEPRLKLNIWRKSSVLTEIAGSFLMVFVSFAFVFFIFSGCLTNLLPGSLWAGIDVGASNWLMASLRDAKIAVPAEWVDYSQRSSFLLRRDPSENNFYALFLAPQHRVPIPHDLVNFKLFVGALGALVLSIPMTLSLISVGLDGIIGQRLVLTPTRLMSVYQFLYLF
ncbi:MAG: hypothetical protein K2Z81_10350, partial [Cyanobacteria bacterium]|nr:hypothetical protein [Cyanobacteriota bacterium]